MRPSRRVLKIVAVVCSFSLIGLYVYDRAGGNVIQKIYPGVAAENERPMMSSSKLKQMFKAVELKQNSSPKLLPGSKSTLVIPEASLENDAGAPKDTVPESSATSSRSPVGDGDDPFSPRPEQSPPVLLHGSKSAAPLISVPTPQVANPKVAPNGPAQQKISQQQGQQTAPSRNNARSR